MESEFYNENYIFGAIIDSPQKKGINVVISGRTWDENIVDHFSFDLLPVIKEKFKEEFDEDLFFKDSLFQGNNKINLEISFLTKSEEFKDGRIF